MPHRTNPPIEERWKLIASIARDDAEGLPPGKDRDALLKKARQLETASHINERLGSSRAEPHGDVPPDARRHQG